MKYAIRTGSQGETSPANREERSSSISGGGLEWAWRRHRDEGIWPHGWRLLQTFPQQRRASRRSHRSGLFRVWRKSLCGIERVAPAERWKEVVRWYLSPEHCEHPETGCPIAALAPEIARAAPAVKKRIAGVMEARRERMLEFMPGRTADERERSYNIIFAAMTGAISTARILPHPVERQKILNSVRDHLLESF